MRAAVPADAAAIADVQVRSWLDAYSGYVEPATMLAKSQGRETVWRERLEGGLLMWVAEQAGRLVGIASARDGELQMLYVAPEAQGRGVGRALLERAIDQLRQEGSTMAVLWVFVQNARARGFYERMGWLAEPASLRDDAWAPELRYRRAL